MSKPSSSAAESEIISWFPKDDSQKGTKSISATGVTVSEDVSPSEDSERRPRHSSRVRRTSSRPKEVVEPPPDICCAPTTRASTADVCLYDPPDSACLISVPSDLVCDLSPPEPSVSVTSVYVRRDRRPTSSPSVTVTPVRLRKCRGSTSPEEGPSDTNCSSDLSPTVSTHQLQLPGPDVRTIPCDGPDTRTVPSNDYDDSHLNCLLRLRQNNPPERTITTAVWARHRSMTPPRAVHCGDSHYVYLPRGYSNSASCTHASHWPPPLPHYASATAVCPGHHYHVPYAYSGIYHHI